MAHEHSIRRYRNWYRKLLRFYPKPHRERFGEGMEQTFNDLLRERAEEERGLLGYALWMFVETSVGIIRENITGIIMLNKRIIYIAIGTGLILLIPLVLTLLGSGVDGEGFHWTLVDFVFMGALLFGTGLTYELVAKRGDTIAYRAAVGVACAAGFLLVWINAAVGIIGDGPVNLMYFGVLAVGFIGAFIARFEPRGMVRTLLATALAQMLIPVIALVLWKAGWQDLLIDPNSPNPPFDPGIAPVFGLNAVFAMLWAVSALLFRSVARKHNGPGVEPTA